MFRDFVEAISCVVAAILAVLAIIFGSVFAYQLTIEKPACAAYGEMSNQKTFYSLGTSCLVQRDGEWVDYSVATDKKQEITVKSK